LATVDMAGRSLLLLRRAPVLSTVANSLVKVHCDSHHV
jgi:hypothetical protein